jgi:L-ribulose-5-phosphate 3-epimerase
MDISLMLTNLRQPFEQALDSVQELGLSAIQFTAADEFAPATFDTAVRGKVVAALESRGIIVSALGTGLTFDLGDDADMAIKMPIARRTLEIAADLGSGIFQAHVGILPRHCNGPRWEAYVRHAAELAAYGEKVGACLALETGPEPPRVLEQLLDTVGSPGLRINYDPANLILWPALLSKNPEWAARSGGGEVYDAETALREYEPVEGVARLAPFIAQVHAKDGTVEGGQEREVPLGEGWIDWPRFIGLLHENGFEGHIAIERETGEDPMGDIGRAIAFLREQIDAVAAPAIR